MRPGGAAKGPSMSQSTRKRASKPNYEWEESFQKGGPWTVLDEHSSGKRDYGNCARIYPVWPAPVFRGELKEHHAIEYQCNNDHIEHVTNARNIESEENRINGRCPGKPVNKRGAQDRNGFSAHRGYQPDSVDAGVHKTGPAVPARWHLLKKSVGASHKAASSNPLAAGTAKKLPMQPIGFTSA